MTQSAAQRALRVQEILEQVLIYVAMLHKATSEPPPSSIPGWDMYDSDWAACYSGPISCSHKLQNAPVWPLFVLQRVNHGFMVTINDSFHLRRMMRILPTQARESECAPLLIMQKAFAPRKISTCSQSGEISLLDCDNDISWTPRESLFTVKLPLNPSAVMKGSWGNIRICSSDRNITLHVFIDAGLWAGIHYSEDWLFDGNATLDDFHARWLKVGSRSAEEHAVADETENVKEWQPRSPRVG